MSQLTSPTRATRPSLRGLERAAVERARLALVPVRRTNAPRAPFAVLVLLILGAGVVGLLMFNTQMQQDSFYATRLQHQADKLTAQQESLQMDLDQLRDPQHLGQQARQLGMVQPANPSFVDLATGKIEGQPLSATGENAIPINPVQKLRTPTFVPPTKYIDVPAKAPVEKPTNGQKVAGGGPASPTGGAATGTNGAGTAAQGATR